MLILRSSDELDDCPQWLPTGVGSLKKEKYIQIYPSQKGIVTRSLMMSLSPLTMIDTLPLLHHRHTTHL